MTIFSHGRIWPDGQKTIEQMANYCKDAVCMRLFVLLAEVCQSDEALQNIKYQPANPSVIGVGFQVSGVRKEKSKTETSSAGKAIELWIGFKGWVFDVDERLDSISQRGH